MKSEMIKCKNKFLVLVLFVGAVLMPKEALARIDFDMLTLSDLTFYPTGCLKSFDVRIKANGDYSTAYGKIAVHDGVPAHNWDWPIKEGTIWGSSWPDEFPEKDCMVAVSSGEFEWTDCENHYLTVHIPNGVIPATTDKEYSVYLWSRSTFGVYADTCFRQKLIVKDGTINLSYDPTLFMCKYDENSKTAETYLFVKDNWFEKIVIPKTVTYNKNVYTLTSIGSNTFRDCSLPPVIMGDNITNIGDWAFVNVSLPSITIGNKVKNIGIWAFRNCSNLTSITIPIGVTNIEKRAFEDCSDLTSIIMEANVTNIGDLAFSGCRNLTSITCRAKTPPTCENHTFETRIFTKATLCVPLQEIAKYQQADIWKEFRHWKTYYDEDQGLSKTKLGDLNRDGKIDQDDADLLAQYIVGKTEIPELFLSKVDMNHDGVIDIRDVVGIERIINGYEVPADK